jgi:hypothetical protein
MLLGFVTLVSIGLLIFRYIDNYKKYWYERAYSNYFTFRRFNGCFWFWSLPNEQGS